MPKKHNRVTVRIWRNVNVDGVTYFATKQHPRTLAVKPQQADVIVQAGCGVIVEGAQSTAEDSADNQN